MFCCHYFLHSLSSQVRNRCFLSITLCFLLSLLNRSVIVNFAWCSSFSISVNIRNFPLALENMAIMYHLLVVVNCNMCFQGYFTGIFFFLQEFFFSRSLLLTVGGCGWLHQSEVPSLPQLLMSYKV